MRSMVIPESIASKGGMAKHAVFGDQGDIHVGTFCDHAALIDEHTVVGAVIFGFQHD